MYEQCGGRTKEIMLWRFKNLDCDISESEQRIHRPNYPALLIKKGQSSSQKAELLTKKN